MSDTTTPTIKRSRGRPKKVFCAPAKQHQTGTIPSNMIILPDLRCAEDRVRGDVTLTNAKNKKQKLDRKKSSSYTISKDMEKDRDKTTHNAEEKRRKDRINILINKLGHLLFDVENGGNKSKRTVLEKAYEYIEKQKNQERQQRGKADILNEAQLVKRIKDLEASVIILLDSLKKHCIKPPGALQPSPSFLPLLAKANSVSNLSHNNSQQRVETNPQASLNNTQTASPSNNEATESPTAAHCTTSQTSGIPLQIHLVLPQTALSQMNTSSVIALTATATAPVISNTVNTVATTEQCMGTVPLTSRDAPIAITTGTNPTSSLAREPNAFVSNSSPTPPEGVMDLSVLVTSMLATNPSTNCKSQDNNGVDGCNTECIVVGKENQYSNVATQSKIGDSVCDAAAYSLNSNYDCNVVSGSKTIATSFQETPSTATVTQPMVATAPVHAHATRNENSETTRNIKNIACGVATSTMAVPSMSTATAQVSTLHDAQQNNATATVGGVSIEASSKTVVPQGFGIDNLLVSDLIASTGTVSCSTAAPPLSATKVVKLALVSSHGGEGSTAAKSFARRPRLPSSGHTVASLLESATTSANGTLEMRKTAIDTSTAIRSASAVITPQSTNAVTTANIVNSSSKRWTSFVESAANSDAFLTSFVLPSNNKNNRRRRRTVKGSGGTTPVKTNKTQAVKTTERLTRSPKNMVFPPTTAPTPVLPTSLPTQPPLMHTSVSHTTTLPSKQQQQQQQLAETATFNKKPPITSAKNAKSSTTIIPPPTQCENKKNNAHATSTNVAVSTTMTTVLKHPVPPAFAPSIANATRQCTPSSSTSKTMHNRTMRDRTVKNKWLMSNDKSQMALNISTPDAPTEQCASPVISYPNIGKRKRKSSFNTMYNQQQGNVKAKHGTTGTDTLLQNTFSAESLSRPSKDNTSKKQRLESKQKTQDFSRNVVQQGEIFGQHQPQQRLPMQPDPSNTLPTILNIFAPAPVPSTQHGQQQTFHSAFSNFSAENLVGNECQLGVMDSTNLNETNFTENMLMAANPQLFTNFSADSLIAGNEPQIPFAINNLLNPPTNQPWNQTWLPQDVNDAIFQNIGASVQPNNNVVRQNTRQILQPTSTECSPIKSIMSILNSTPNNNPANFHFENLPTGMPNMFPNNAGGGNHVNQQRMLNARDDFMVNTWLNRNHEDNNSNAGMKNVSGNTIATGWNTYANLTSRNFGGKAAGLSHPANGNLHPAAFQSNKMPGRAKEASGPMFGNISLVNSITPT